MSAKLPMSDREALLIKNAVLSFKSIMKRVALVEGKKIIEKANDFSLGELAKQIRHRFGTRTPDTKDTYEVLRKYKDEVVVLG